MAALIPALIKLFMQGGRGGGGGGGGGRPQKTPLDYLNAGAFKGLNKGEPEQVEVPSAATILRKATPTVDSSGS